MYGCSRSGVGALAREFGEGRPDTPRQLAACMARVFVAAVVGLAAIHLGLRSRPDSFVFIPLTLSNIDIALVVADGLVELVLAVLMICADAVARCEADAAERDHIAPRPAHSRLDASRNVQHSMRPLQSTPGYTAKSLTRSYKTDDPLDSPNFFRKISAAFAPRSTDTATTQRWGRVHR